MWPQLNGDHAVNGFKASGLLPVNRNAVEHRIIRNDGASEDLPSPRRALRKAIFDLVSPDDSNKERRTPRKRVQHSNGKVSTEALVLERLRKEEIARKEEEIMQIENIVGGKASRQAKEKGPKANAFRRQ